MKTNGFEEMYAVLRNFEGALEQMSEFRSDANVQVGRLCNDMHKLEVENERLRKLCMEMYEDECMDEDKWRYRDRMQGLGMDVYGSNLLTELLDSQKRLEKSSCRTS